VLRDATARAIGEDRSYYTFATIVITRSQFDVSSLGFSIPFRPDQDEVHGRYQSK
jgi:hypothetical protein